MKALFEQYKAWQAANWDEPNCKRSFLKFIEEVGELAAGLYRGDGVAIKDAMADVVISLLGVACAEGIDLPAELETVWAEVRQRNYRRFPKNGVSA